MTLSIEQLTRGISNITTILAQPRETDKDTKVDRVRLMKLRALAEKKIAEIRAQNIAERRALHVQQSAQMASLNTRLAALKA